MREITAACDGQAGNGITVTGILPFALARRVIRGGSSLVWILISIVHAADIAWRGIACCPSRLRTVPVAYAYGNGTVIAYAEAVSTRAELRHRNVSLDAKLAECSRRRSVLCAYMAVPLIYPIRIAVAVDIHCGDFRMGRLTAFAAAYAEPEGTIPRCGHAMPRRLGL